MPPQAYTRDTLAKAYAWLQNQSESIKEMAQGADSLVSLYLKAQRSGDDSNEKPSVQTFKSELKNIAGLMGEFEVTEPIRFTHSSPQPQAPKNTESAAQPQTRPIIKNPNYNPPNLDLKALLDDKSWQMIHEVKNTFNLSSENEALRLLVTLGYSKAKSIL